MSTAAPLVDFRAEVRTWLEANCPLSMRSAFKSEAEWFWGGRNARFPSDDARLWFERMVAKGWTAPDWPVEYGGAGLGRAEADIIRAEMRRMNCRKPLISLGISMLGPILMEFGTEEQRRAHLPSIARGEIRWCQGFSEPGAGSDLASLNCRAVRDGDDYVITGQKIWTSEAHRSDKIFCLVRTGKREERQNGISFMLVDMASDGVSTAPIELISGASDFCITTFDGVRIPASDRVGEEGQGWTMAKKLLQYERAMYSSEARGERGPHKEDLEDFAIASLGLTDGRLADPVIRDQITQVKMDRACYEAAVNRLTALAQAGRPIGAEASMFKYYLSELHKRRTDLRMRIAGARGLGWEGPSFDERELLGTREWLRSRADSIAGGTSEIQLNIIAKRVLGLPE